MGYLLFMEQFYVLDYLLFMEQFYVLVYLTFNHIVVSAS